MLKIQINFHDDADDDGTRLVRLVAVTDDNNVCDTCDDTITDALAIDLAYDDDAPFSYYSTHHLAHFADHDFVASAFDA